MLRYVILRHELPETDPRASHWDLMLEADANQPLLTWELQQTPMLGVPQQVRQLPNHRRVYLDYEGPLSGDRGRVTQWDSGSLEWIEMLPDQIGVALRGRRLVVRLQLTRVADELWDLELREDDRAANS